MLKETAIGKPNVSRPDEHSSERLTGLMSAAWLTPSPYKRIKQPKPRRSHPGVVVSDPQPSTKGELIGDYMSRALEGAGDRLMSFKKRLSVHFEENKILSLKKEDVISKVWVDPEVLENPLYVDYTIHHQKKRVVNDGQISTVHEISVKRKHDVYDQYDRGLLVVPKPSTKRLQAYLTPIKATKKLHKSDEILRRAKSENRGFVKHSDSSLSSEGRDTILPKITQSSIVRADLSQITKKLRTSKPAVSLSHIKSKALENAITRLRLRKRPIESLHYQSYDSLHLD